MNKDEILEIVLSTLNKTVVEDIMIYNMENYTPFYDYSVIGSITNTRQGNASISYLKKVAAEQDLPIRCSMVHDDTRWFVIDLQSVVVHLFVGEERKRYNLDGIYSLSNYIKQ